MRATSNKKLRRLLLLHARHRQNLCLTTIDVLLYNARRNGCNKIFNLIPMGCTAKVCASNGEPCEIQGLFRNGKPILDKSECHAHGEIKVTVSRKAVSGVSFAQMRLNLLN